MIDDTKVLILVGLVLLSDVMFSGLIFGWAPMLLMLQEEGQYSELCTADHRLNHPHRPCVAQENQLNLMFALASFAVNAGALPVGILLDYFGPRLAIVGAGLIEIAGLLLMAFSDSKTCDYFVPAYVLMAIGGQITMLASYPASFVLLRYQTMILAGISCLFDASSIILLAIYSLKSMFLISRTTLFCSYAVVALTVYSSLFVAWKHVEHLLPTVDPLEAENAQLLEKASPCPGQGKKDARKLMENYYAEYGSLSETELGHRLSRTSDGIVEMYTGGMAGAKLSERSLKHQLCTFEFLFALLFAATHVLRANIYIGTNTKLLGNYGDAVRNYSFTKLFSLVLPLGFIFIPCIDQVVEQGGLSSGLLLTNGLGLVYNILALIPSLYVQCLTFFVFTAFRAFLYAVISAFNAKNFGLHNLGTIIGIIFSTGALVNLLELPAITLSNEYYAGDLTRLHLILLVLGLMLVPFTECYRRREHRRQEYHETLVLATSLGNHKSEQLLPTLADSPPKRQHSTYHRAPCKPSPKINRKRP